MGLLRNDLPHYTYDDYKRWKGNWELIDGIAYAMAPSPIFEHQDISGNIHLELKRNIKNCENCRSILALEGEFINEKFIFELDEFKIELDFKNIFED